MIYSDNQKKKDFKIQLNQLFKNKRNIKKYGMANFKFIDNDIKNEFR